MKTFRRQELNDNQIKVVDEICELFLAFANNLDSLLPENAEKTTALRKLREARECAVYAAAGPE
jgi:hypothetical protein